MAVKVVMPRLTDTMLQGVISEWLKQEGDEVKEGEPLYAVETDKASVEVTSSATGVLLKILVPQGDSVEVGGAVAIVGAKGEDVSALLAPTAAARTQREEAPRPSAAPSGRVLASPAAKRKAKELAIDLGQVRGTGEGGLITEKDLDAFVAASGATASAAPSPAAKYGPEERIPLAGITRAMYERMTLSTSIPQVTTVAETDATELLALSKARGISITTFIVRAVCDGLKRFPQVNSSLDGKTVVRKGYMNIGVSVATPRGLIVPVLHNCEGKDLATLSAELKGLAAKAREGKLALEDISGGTFTITNSGVFGSLFFTPRINAPESAILGMGKIMKQPVVRPVAGEDQIVIRSMIYLSLTYDHRHIDGETAVTFLQEVKKALQDPANL